MERRVTRQVKVGNTYIGGNSPILIQSMLNTMTMNTEECVEQAIKIVDAGGELVRITAQGVREAENLKNIREEFRRQGYSTPISADIHFVPEAALEAAKWVEKVRINPGNFIDKRATFNKIEYTDEEYEQELMRLEVKFKEFLDVCRRSGAAIRIGTNHGSLSDRIMSRYGDTPEGMVEATMEFLRVCVKENFHNVVISLKSSICSVMVEAVRKLVSAMEREGMNYPLHLGVTEAGEGEDGRIKSALGIGTLLCEGVGDTIRVSLTEAPEAEIPVARRLVELLTTDSYDLRCSIDGEVLKARSTISDRDDAKLFLPAKLGAYLLSGKVKELILELPDLGDDFAKGLAQNILQAAGVKRFKTEFVSCPGCGRTLFDLQKAVAEVKQEFNTPALSSLKIAVMGCVVNGPGEMGDADYGYVGAGSGKVNLYKGKKLVEKAIPESEAIERLKLLMRRNGENI